MKSHARAFFHRTFSLVIVLTVLGTFEALAQRGRWVPHAPPPGSGTRLYDCGDKIAVYTLAQSSSCLFYDGWRSQWVEVPLGATQTFTEVLASGNVALARSDTLLVAYSASSGTWDTVRIRGTYLSPAAAVSYRLAAAATNQMMYVFDCEDGAWHERAITPPWDYTGYGLLHAHDDYALVVLSHADGQTDHVVYSYPQHAFNAIERMAGPLPMDAGYVSVTYDANTATLLGYSAKSNQYSLQNLAIQQYAGCFYACVPVTGTSCGFMWTEVPAPESRIDHFYCYDTRLGQDWYHATRYWDPQYDGGTQPLAGDRYIVFPYSHDLGYDEYTISYVIYSGFTGGYVTRPDRTQWTPNLTFLNGPSCFLAVDSLKIWAYDATTGDEQIEMTYRNWMPYNTELQRHYAALILRDPSSGPTMGFYAYSSFAHSFTALDLKSTWNAAVSGGHSALLINLDTFPPETVFYSGEADTVHELTFIAGQVPAGTVEDYLATSFLGSQGYLFDAVAGNLMSFTGEFGHAKLGTSAFIHWDASRVAHGYNIGSRQWSEIQMDADGVMTDVRDWIGFLPSYQGTTAFGKYYAYNGLYDSWVPLVPEGAYAGQRLGNRIGLVVRTTMLYVFDPELTTPVSSSEVLPLVWQLEQNYPNPFNPRSVIRYQVPSARNVKLAVYDLLGREVAVLVDEKQAPGRYEAVFDASQLATGVYLYRLTADDFVETRKMLLIK